jgi:predicted DNA-binding ribbon-helix-helix protein
MRAEFRKYIRQKIMTLRYGDKRTGVAIEPVFMDALRILAWKQNICATDLIRQIEAAPRPAPQSLASALRVYCMQQMMPHLWD